jgi:hypothetical protein
MNIKVAIVQPESIFGEEEYKMDSMRRHYSIQKTLRYSKLGVASPGLEPPKTLST